MKCKICKSDTKVQFITKILNKYNVRYFHCQNCGFLQTEEPYWLEKAYKQPINDIDTGILQRNIEFARITSVILYQYFEKTSPFLDYAGGYGIFIRLMRDIGFDFYWYDPFSENIFAKGFECSEEKNFEAITIFECFEHFANPLAEIEKIIDISPNIIFSTNLLPDPVPDINKWWYYTPEHGQHIAFYTMNTLKYIAEKYSLNLISNGSYLHLFTIEDINQKKFRKILKKSRKYFNNTIKKSMSSRTLEDMHYIKSIIKQ
ncbi:MAG: class I SAM-dependent methyltransferase [Bacteroidota bacterium]